MNSMAESWIVRSVHITFNCDNNLNAGKDICILQWLRYSNVRKKRSDQTTVFFFCYAICNERKKFQWGSDGWHLLAEYLIADTPYWWACMIASEMKAAETWRPPNQRPFRPWIAFLADSMSSNLTYISPWNVDQHVEVTGELLSKPVSLSQLW